MTTPTTLTITFDSDWRVGAGAGIPGDLDAVVRRDDAGLPVVPARTVTGIWRDACERVAAALGGGWLGWVEVLFGGRDEGDRDAPARPAVLSVRTAVLPGALHARLAAEPELAARLYGARPGVQIDRNTGQAVPDMLRRIETVRAGLTFDAPVELADAGWDDDQRRTAGVLLTLGARDVRALGGDRRRGLGACRWELPVDRLTAAALAAPAPPRPAEQPVPPAPAARLPVPTGERTRVVVELVAECVDPLVSTAVATDSITRGRAYLPGGRVLPGVVARAREAGLEVEHLIAGGELVCTPLVPEVDGGAGRPAPLAVAVPKGTSGPAVNRLRAGMEPGVTPVPLRRRWIGPSDGADPVVLEAATELRPHNTVQDRTQRPTTAVGGFYTFEAIRAGSRLRGRVTAQLPAGEAERFAAALTGTWRMGRARKDEYGRVAVTARVADAPPEQLAPRDSVVLWFVTDAVLLDARLTPVATVDGVLGALGAEIGVAVKTVSHGVGRVSASVVFGRDEGWHGRWTRPRPTLGVLGAGSVLHVCRTDGEPFTTDQLARLARGVGRRRVEGFGEVLLDDPLLAAERWSPRPVVPRAATAGTPARGPDDPLLVELRRAARRALIEHRAAAVPAGRLGAIAVPDAAGLRAGLRAALAAEDGTVALKQFHFHLGHRSLQSKQWTGPVREELRRLADTDRVWEVLGVDPADRDPDLKVFALRRLLAHLWAGGTAGRTTEGTDDGS